MTIVTAALAVLSANQLTLSNEAALLQVVSRAVNAGDQSRLESYFTRRQDAAYIWEVAERRGDLKAMKTSMVVPPADRNLGSPYWLILHTRHDIQEDHDMVLSIAKTANGPRVGAEIPEWSPDPYRIRFAKIDAKLTPERNRIQVQSELTLEAKPNAKSLIMRLGDPYRLTLASADGSTLKVMNGEPDDVVRPEVGAVTKVGGLIILPSDKPIVKLTLRYEGSINTPDEDKITPKVAYVTAWWVPSIGRLPFKTQTRVTGPKHWTMVSEGEPASAEAFGPRTFPVSDTERQVAFQCDVPISYPKIVGGQYKIAAEKLVGERLYRSYQLDPVEAARGQKDVELMADAIKFYEKTLGPFPFKSYSCFDADTYYGIESYSYTLLRRNITTRFIAHEIGHTYFGGLVPSAYTRDTWNEPLTQFVDSVLFSGNKDGTLQSGLKTINVSVPLSKMNIAHAYYSAAYHRGAYVMQMLCAEIGQDAVIRGLQAMVKDRVGKETVWDDLRPYFEQTSKTDLKWFWDQWIHRSAFPKVYVKDAQVVQREGKFRTFVRVTQEGDSFFKMRLKLTFRRYNQTWSKDIVLAGNQDSYIVGSDVEPAEVSVDVFGLAMAEAGPAVRTHR